MADNYLMLDGKKYELADDLIAALRHALAEPEKKSPFERKEDGIYFFITEHGEVNFSVEGCYASNSAHYDVANYCTDKALMEQRAMHETLNRLLWRFREEHDADASGTDQYVITKDKDGGVWPLNLPTVCDTFFDYRLFGVEYFHSWKTAEAAVEEIVIPFLAAHPDFVW